ncbi:hypothetical protein ACFLRF_05505 [Candidatus Altiarchaeota archaeon]
MQRIEPGFRFDEKTVNDKIESLEGLDAVDEHDRDTLRKALAGKGLQIRSLHPAKPLNDLHFLAQDASMIKREMRYHALWAFHGISVSCVYDGLMHKDMLVGQGMQPYGSLMYSSELDLGVFRPYSDLDERLNSLRVGKELGMMLDTSDKSLELEGKPLFYLIDGSLATSLKHNGSVNGATEHEMAKEAIAGILARDRVVGMVEDSHATDISRIMGYEMTNMMMFEIALEPGEYVAQKADGISVCYIKLPSKEMESMPAGVSPPLTVRWEFNYEGFEDDLNNLAHIWIEEADILHPQLYPVRIADYLTRRVKVAGLLDLTVKKKELLPQYRKLRQGLY